jgi:hypothetical protein
MEIIALVWFPIRRLACLEVWEFELGLGIPKKVAARSEVFSYTMIFGLHFPLKDPLIVTELAFLSNLFHMDKA